MEDAFVFIVGSPRSGTTILGEILDCHSQISQWYEPYFVWDHYFRKHPHDERCAWEATPPVIHQIRDDFYRFLKKSGARLIVDKSPRNSLKIPFIRKIFPEARFIHLIRDGRDATLSIHREWRRRLRIVNDPNRGNRFNHLNALNVIKLWLKRQPFIEDKVRAFWFETHGHMIDKAKHLNRLRWDGNVGWGPRFKGWEAVYREKPLLHFNAYQWLKCVQSTLDAWEKIPEGRKLEIRYEAMIDETMSTVTKIMAFLNLELSNQFLTALPVMKKGNYNKWQKAFSQNQIDAIGTILNPMLTGLGYDIHRNSQ